MRIVLWVGNEANQMALANKIHQLFPISGIVTETKKSKRALTFSTIIEKVFEKLFLKAISASWFGMLNYYHVRFSKWPETEILNVENINAEATISFTKSIIPDLIIVSGTRLIKDKLLSLKPSIGIVNLHTGISPYIKGGPNCTNWCIATKQFHLIGNTIMWINKGIDTGNLITTEHTTFTSDETLPEVHIKVMEHAHELYLKSIHYLAEGRSKNIPQDTVVDGITYYSKQWGLKEKINLVKNFKLFRNSINSEANLKKKSIVQTIKL
ncbi:MAG: hypothetical protein IPP71_06345 [Bacteroidetes bacterium]|nr:hypothetical protein [Bacteroidota bacterium]